MTAQELFDKSCEEYNQAMNMIDTLGDFVRAANLRFSDNIAKREFDYILQCILIKVALGDGNFSKIETSFIDKITDRGDILAYIQERNQFSERFSWDALYNSDTHIVELLALILDNLIEEKVDDFLFFFAALDAALPEVDICEFFSKKILAIGLNLTMVDGFRSRNEVEALMESVRDVFVVKWKAHMKMAAGS